MTIDLYVHDVTPKHLKTAVTNQDGRVIAEFRGNSRVIKGQHFEE